MFFGVNDDLDLSYFYDDKKHSHEKVLGLINLLKSYKFTIDENTPLDEEIALDPELLGKVFENLLASYNPETKNTARKQTGSFYTPREIVNYMVDESFISYLKSKLTPNPSLSEREGDLEIELRKLFSYNIENLEFSENEKEILLKAINECKILDPACGSGAFPMGTLNKMVNIIHNLDPDNTKFRKIQIEKAENEINADIKRAEEINDDKARDVALKELEDKKMVIKDAFDNNYLDYARKLYLIENCIFGIDIQPIAVQISKLRFFISLITDQKVSEDKPNFGINPLPNLETKFVASNTLVGINRGKEKEQVTISFENPEITDKKNELKRVRKKHFGARTTKTKEKYRSLDQQLRKDISDLLQKENSSLSDDETLKLANWNPYDQNASSEFFDLEWMFGIKDGFDIVIGNPPYVQIQSFSGQKVQKDWESQKYETFAKTGDIYSLFYEKGNILLKDKGLLCFITSNKWMRAGYGESTRKYFAEKTNPLLLVDFGGYKVFESATVDTNILIFEKGKNTNKTVACSIQSDFRLNNNIVEYVNTNKTILDNLSSESWIILSKDEYEIKKRIEEIGTPLKYWDISIYRGILTGFNEAFIIDGKKKDELIQADPKNAEIIKPILRGRDIKKYKAEFADLWLINTHNGYKDIKPVDINNYPIIKEHLDKYSKELEKRYDKGVTPYNLRNCAYINEFEKEKIVYPNMTKYKPFILDRRNYYTNQKCFIITSEKESVSYLLSILNSWVFDFAFKDYFPELLGGTRELSKIFFVNLPIPKISTENQKPFEIMVDFIIFAKENGFESESKIFESVIDGMVYDLYFPEEMKKGGCYITDRIKEKVKPFDSHDTQESKIEYIKVLNKFFNNDKVVYSGLIHRRTIDIVKTVQTQPSVPYL